MHSLAPATVIILFLLLASARAEEKPNGLLSDLGSTTISGYVSTSRDAVAQLSPDETAVSVRATRRLIFEDRFNETPAGGITASFIFRRSGDTNTWLTVDFVLS
jgi:hypothetical protein